MFYPRLDPPATLESKKFPCPRHDLPESRFNQAGKASEGAPRWIRSFPRPRPHPQCPYRRRFAERCRACDRRIAPEASRSDSERSALAARGAPACAATAAILRLHPELASPDSPESVTGFTRGRCGVPPLAARIIGSGRQTAPEHDQLTKQLQRVRAGTPQLTGCRGHSDDDRKRTPPTLGDGSTPTNRRSALARPPSAALAAETNTNRDFVHQVTSARRDRMLGLHKSNQCQVVSRSIN